jgi:2-polyprenyl-3-methyl-5-hydroxy-6-metoxy-1,4-benzoquinol methylase
VEPNKEKVFREYCPSCKGKEFSEFLTTRDYFLTQEEFKLVHCNNCELVFTNPIPLPSDLAAYYDSPDYLSHKVSKFSLTGFIYNQLREINLKGKYKLISKFKKNGKILDIGQGTGEFLNFMQKKGWETKGVEPNESARKFAIKNYNLSVVDEKAIQEISANYFDVISMWHVLEHVVNLRERMQQVAKLLKKDGILVIAVPNLNSPDSQKYKDKWAGLDVPRHLYHFTVKTMDFLLSSSGFEVILLHPLKLDAYYVSMLSEKYLKNSFPYPAALINGFNSNLSARKENNYSSMVFVAKPI